MDSSPPTPPAFRVSPLFRLQYLSSTFQVFLISGLTSSSLHPGLPSRLQKKNLFKHQSGSTPRPSSLLIGKPQKSALGLPSPIRAEHTNTIPGHLKSKDVKILIQHLDTLVHYTPLFFKAILLTSANATVCFLYRLHLLSMSGDSLLTIMTANLDVGACPRSNNIQ
ncbi:hypothetical protein TNCV_2747801 [Trichonephila clavipes]|nr:hypothetical protein TNCV_2747801 [Trichonephila clavipes]